MRPGDVAERADRPGAFVAVISREVVPGYVIAVHIAVSDAYASAVPSPLHTIGTRVQGYLIPTNASVFRVVDLRHPVDTVEEGPLAACRKLFVAALLP
jgi:hypothetical protein